MAKDNYNVTYDISDDLKIIIKDIAKSLKEIAKNRIEVEIEFGKGAAYIIEGISDGIINVGKNTFSPNVADSNMEPANIVDVLNHISNSIRFHAKTIEKVVSSETSNPTLETFKPKSMREILTSKEFDEKEYPTNE